MTRGPRARRAPPARPRGQRLRLALVALALVAGAIAIVVLIRPPAPRPAARPAGGALDAVARAWLDSLAEADRRSDWVGALRFAERLGARFPDAHTILLARATAWSNFAIARRPALAIERPALRTSLERIECLARSMRLADSAAMAAPDAARWSEALRRLGELDEAVGLPGDALLVYETVKERLPDEPGIGLRAYVVRAYLYDPLAPDTSEWDRFQRSRGLR